MNIYKIEYIDINGESAETHVRAQTIAEAEAYFNVNTPFLCLAVEDEGEDNTNFTTPSIGPK